MVVAQDEEQERQGHGVLVVERLGGVVGVASLPVEDTISFLF
jgi:hypothetical protein